MAINVRWLSADAKSEVKKLQIITKEMSLTEIPATKIYPALCPLLMLCLSMANITGPTEIANKIPNTKPFKTGANISTKQFNPKVSGNH